MDKLWDGYIRKTLPLDIELRNAYSQAYNIQEKWIQMPEITLGDYIEKCLNELEYAGYNLDSTPLKILEDKFLQLEVTITAPQEYIDLTECLNDLENQISECDEKGYSSMVKSQLISIKEKIEDKIKAMA